MLTTIVPALARRIGVCAALLGLVAASTSASASPRLDVQVRGSSVVVAFDLQPEHFDDLAPRLEGGASVSAMWVAECRRDVRFWRDLPLQQASVRVRAEPAAEAGMFVITRHVNGRPLGGPLTATLEQTYRYLTAFPDVTMLDVGAFDVGTPYRLRISAVLTSGRDERIRTPVLAEAKFVR